DDERRRFPCDADRIYMTAIWEGFDRYLASRAPSDSHKAEVRRYRERIRDIIAKRQELMALFQSGSFQHETAVMPFSDVDYIARFWFEDRPRSSTTILNNLRDLLRDQLWEASVTVSRPTVTLKFPGLVSQYEITPAYLKSGTSDENRILLIPAPGGDWRGSAPQAHHEFFEVLDRKHGAVVRDTPRGRMGWKHVDGVTIPSSELVLRVADYGKNIDSVFPLTAIRSIVTTQVKQDLPAMHDPARLVSRISACSSESARLSAMSHLRRFKKNIDDAVAAWLANERFDMNQALQAIWGSDFPYCDT